MYTGFNLKIEQKLSPFDKYKYQKKGEELFSNFRNTIEDKLDELLLDNGNLDGGKMQNNWFPAVEADVFISHSHKNEADAIILAGRLYDTFGIKSFLDSCIWGYSDDLLKRLDERFCKQDNGTFDYQKRNFTTSHVHMMLSTALTQMIDKAECLFFLNTPESISLSESFKTSTLSPWIYSEIMISQLIRKKKLSEYRKARRQVKMYSRGGKVLNEAIEYPVTLTHLETINDNDINQWIIKFNKEEYPLDLLYFIKSESKIFKSII